MLTACLEKLELSCYIDNELLRDLYEKTIEFLRRSLEIGIWESNSLRASTEVLRDMYEHFWSFSVFV